MKSYSLNHAMIDDRQARAAQAYAEKYGEPGYKEIDKLYIDQRYDGYDDENHETWQILYRRQMEFLRDAASRVYLDGAATIRLSDEGIPNLAAINARLAPVTGWQSRAVPGFVPTLAFFACLSRREFPTTIVIRPKDSIDYLPEPDIFHDIFGHVPLHADADFGTFLESLGQAALLIESEEETKRLARLFWFTVEFGLIEERGELRVYGSGLISSPGESRHALSSEEVDRRPFDLEEVCETAFEIDHYQPILYVLESFAQLKDAMEGYAARLRRGTPVMVTTSE